MATNSLSGHITSECAKNKVFDLDKIADLPIEEAWENVVKTAKEAVESRDLDDFREVCCHPSPLLARICSLLLSLY